MDDPAATPPESVPEAAPPDGTSEDGPEAAAAAHSPPTLSEVIPSGVPSAGAAPVELPTMPLIEHLRELRKRLVYSVVALVGAMLVSLPLSGQVMFGLTGICGPDCHFQAIEPLEKLTTWFRIALIIGLVVSSPVILYQVVAFVVPALHRHERRYLYLFLPGAGVLFALGLLFGYFFVLPRTIGFLVGFLGGGPAEPMVGGGPVIETSLRISAYITFLTNLLLVLGLAFQTPLVVFLLSKLGVLTPRVMSRYRRHAMLVIAVLAAVLTPTPDPFTMFMVAAPMYLLYELGGLMARVL